MKQDFSLDLRDLGSRAGHGPTRGGQTQL